MVNDSPELNIDRLPLILAGPMLRHTTTEVVTVWLALRLPAQVSLQVYSTLDCGSTIDLPIANGVRKTVTVGTSLHIVTISATNPEGKTLNRGEIYAYDLEFTIGETKYNLATALTSAEYPSVCVSYFPHDLPTFVLPPIDLNRVKIAHGSCRKPHGDGQDALAILDRLLAANADAPDTRPQQLFLTGDQIYGDDVASPLLWVATHLGELILGWDEKLPIGTWDRPRYSTLKELPSGERGEIATKVGGFTAGLHRKRSKVHSHLFGLGEYCAAYLLAWSPIVWPKQLPSGAQMGCDGVKLAAAWDREVADMHSFIQSLWAVRRVLANTVTYSIFDDHDVSDDWNLNQAWCLRVLGKPLGRRVVSNALLAYSLFQGWGNTPAQFEPGTSGYRLFGWLQELIYTRGYDESIEQEIGRYVGLPPRQSHSNLPEFAIDGEDLILARDRQSLTWHYTIDCGGYLAIVCDTRTQRGYPQNAKLNAPPRLLSKSGLDAQITTYLNSDLAQGKEVLIILPTNLFGLRAIDWVHHHQINRGKMFATDVGDAWNIRLDAVAELLDRIARTRDRAIVLTGDIHYAGAMEFTYRDREHNSTQLVQFTASPCKNEERLAKILQSKLKALLLPEFRRTCVGTFSPPRMKWQGLFTNLYRDFKPDWWGKLRLIRFKIIKLEENTSVEHNILVQLHRLIRRYFYSGGEVIGFNNLAIVSWHRDDLTIVAIQDVYWIADLDYHQCKSDPVDVPLSISRYQIAMEVNQNRCSQARLLPTDSLN
ncbi:PhoD-like phosphatase [Chamaesiphon sp. VAR_48_metabat_135_sub]|uniref:PhoD-like phosphatase n=1 Tax=Chamaesiphon sp. VAR_48_metabat_135_sub TaxID=2964699 RepID=UPI00286D2497|nr:PhoD-like phosphatase [Chamaesiphon sp. VAR_48_metabat_135_sub]